MNRNKLHFPSLIILTIILLLNTKTAQSQDVYIDNDCHHNQNLDLYDRFTIFYGRKFTTNNQNYWFYAGQYQDGAAIFCISNPNFTQAEPIRNELIDSQFIEKIEQKSNNSPIFRVQVREGQNSGVPLVDYQLDLSNPNRPTVQYLMPQR